MKCAVTTLDNKKSGDIDLDDAVFGLPVRADLLSRMVNWQLAKRRSGNHKVKRRNEIRGSTAKIYRQKGTGRARHGSRGVSQFVGGGSAFGPVVRSHAHDVPKKVRRLALRCALSAKQADGKLVVVDSLALESHKTGELAKKMAGLGWSSALVIDGAEVDDQFALPAASQDRW